MAHVTNFINGYTEGVAVIRRIGVIASNVQIHPGGPPSHTHDSQIFCFFRAEDPGLFQAVTSGFRRVNQPNETLKFAGERIDGGTKRDLLRGIPAPSHSTDADHAAQETISRQLFVQADQHFLQPAGMRIGDHEADICGDCADVRNMIANSFELQKDRSYDQRPERHFHLGSSFDGLAECCSMGKAGIPGNALREKYRLWYGQLLEELFRTFMRIEHAKLQIKNRLPSHRETKMPGLDDPCMNRPYGHLKNTFTQSGPVDVAFSLERR